ncbi:MAG: NYN domain-containing protein [Acidobacteriaceae bacterium]|nr:NYN domain-containing protein [Acidobacteriaceae bacterium]MBV9779848.1 NYN domain-containing protein [Acidobacteriaceae bacterium]
MQDRLSIAVFVDYDNIEIGVKSTLRREFDVSLPLGALKERGDIVAKFAYANWGRQEGATRQMAENAVQMVQRIPSPRGDKNGADINLALDALEMAFTHAHVNAFAIVSGDSDFIPLVNKLKEYGKTVFVVGGKAFTSTILQQNCHEFVSYESLLEDGERIVPQAMPDRRERGDRGDRRERKERGQRPAPLDLTQVMPLVERALQVLERRAVQPQLGLLKSTMLQLDPAFSERAYGAGSFSDFVEKLKRADFINVSGSGGRYVIERRGGHSPEKAAPKPEEALPLLRDVLETHRMELENGATAEELEQWVQGEHPQFELAKYGFQQFSEFLNYAQDKTVVRSEPDEERGLIVHLGAEFYPPALPEPVAERVLEEEDEPQPIVEGQPTIFEPNPPPPKPKKAAAPRKRAASGAAAGRRPRKRKPE